MASTFKSLTNNDVTSTRTLLHEAIPLTGALISGTYGDRNIKNFSHGMFQSVYDYPFLSSSANHLFDVSFGHSSDAANSSYTQNSKKLNIYNQMAQILVGHDVTGGIRKFDRDGDLTAGQKLSQCFFLSFSRLLNKDEIKKGSFSISFITGGLAQDIGVQKSDDAGPLLTLQDHNAQNSYFVNSSAGEYGLLLSSSTANTNTALGLVYYQAGIAVITSSVFRQDKPEFPSGGGSTNFGIGDTISDPGSGSAMEVQNFVTGSTIRKISDSLRRRISNIQFNNTTELNSTIYYCRAHHNEFNYSANPTYISASKMRVKNISTDTPVSYITTVGLYSADNELLAVAKLSEALKKDPTTEFTLRVRLDY